MVGFSHSSRRGIDSSPGRLPSRGPIDINEGITNIARSLLAGSGHLSNYIRNNLVHLSGDAKESATQCSQALSKIANRKISVQSAETGIEPKAIEVFIHSYHILLKLNERIDPVLPLPLVRDTLVPALYVSAYLVLLKLKESGNTTASGLVDEFKSALVKGIYSSPPRGDYPERLSQCLLGSDHQQHKDLGQLLMRGALLLKG